MIRYRLLSGGDLVHDGVLILPSKVEQGYRYKSMHRKFAGTGWEGIIATRQECGCTNLLKLLFDQSSSSYFMCLS